MAKIEKYCPSGVYDPAGYSQGIKVTGAQSILFLAGQVAYDKDGGVAFKGDFKGQARAVFGAIKKLVEAGGGTLDNVVKINTYVTDVRNRPDFRAVRDEFFGAKGPASTMVEVCALAHPDYLIEIEAIAVVGNGARGNGARPSRPSPGAPAGARRASPRRTRRR